MLLHDEGVVGLGPIGRCIWITGLPAAGKSTLANALQQRFQKDGRNTYILDGDILRLGLNSDLGFSEADRIENIRRVAEVARLMADAGLIVLVAVISPFRTGREKARGLFAKGKFIEVFLDTPLEVCERRDPKGMYARARRRELHQFTGIDSPFEPPIHAEVRCDTSVMSVVECVDFVFDNLPDLHAGISGNG
jgi:adenylyl-sulfate kinase